MQKGAERMLEVLDEGLGLFVRTPGVGESGSWREIRAGTGVVGSEATVLGHQDEQRRSPGPLWENGISHGTPPYRWIVVRQGNGCRRCFCR